MAKIPPVLPITAEQSRAARFQLGLTQAAVIKESELPGYKLKQFETGRFVPDITFLESLRDYYTDKGIDLAAPETNEDQSVGKKSGQQTKGPGGSMIRPVSRMCFYVSDEVSQEVVNKVLERMDGNDDRIAELLLLPVKSGFISEFDEATVENIQAAFSAMAENYLLFRFLQGRSIVSDYRDGIQPETLANVVSRFFAGSPLATVASLGDSSNQGLQAKPVKTVSEGDEE